MCHTSTTIATLTSVVPEKQETLPLLSPAGAVSSMALVDDNIGLDEACSVLSV